MNKSFKAMKAMIAMVAVVFGMMAFAGTASAAGGVVTGVTQTDSSKTSVTLQWDAYIGVDIYYQIELSTDGTAFSPMSTSATSSTSRIISGLTPGASYYAKVCAYTDFYSSSKKQLVAESVPIQVYTESDLEQVSGITQTDATTNSFTMSWQPVANAVSYTVERYESGVGTAVVGTVLAPDTSITISGVGASHAGSYRVTANSKTDNGISQTGASSSWVTMRTAPAKVQQAGMTNYYDNISVAYYGCTRVDNCDGYQLQVQDYKGKTLYTDTSSSASFRISSFWKGKFVRARIRAYINLGTERRYGAWSAFSYSASSKKVIVKRAANKKKITVSWKKISGADGYKVSIATSQDGKYKKVKSVGKKVGKCTITKCGKKKLNKRKTYYIKVQYLIKVGGKKISSQVAGMGSI